MINNLLTTACPYVMKKAFVALLLFSFLYIIVLYFHFSSGSKKMQWYLYVNHQITLGAAGPYYSLALRENNNSDENEITMPSTLDTDTAVREEAAKIDFVYNCTDFQGTVVHIGIVMSQSDSRLSLLVLLKSLLVNRHSPLHLHILTADDVSTLTVKTLLSTWNVPSFKHTIYTLYDISVKAPWINTQAIPIPTLKLFFQILIPSSVKHFIVVAINALIIRDIGELWKYADYSYSRAIRITTDHFQANVLLFKHQKSSLVLRMLKKKVLTLGSVMTITEALSQLPLVIPCNIDLHQLDCRKMVVTQQFWKQKGNWIAYSKTNMALKYDGDLLHNIHLKCNEHFSTNHKGSMAPSSKHYCSDLTEIAGYLFRTLLYFFGKPYFSDDVNDVTLVTQVSFDRISRLPVLLDHWRGPVSIAIYVADSELKELYDKLSNFTIVAERARVNLAIHAVFKHSTVYPINYLRNVALNYTSTPFVFLNDFDLQPNYGIYQKIKKAIVKHQMNTHHKMALVVPAFETTGEKSAFPQSKQELVHLVQQHRAQQFHVNIWPKGHAPTWYSKWINCKKSYTVKYRNQYEPYVVVASDVVRYDTRFVGYGWNKVSHIMELNAQGYQFLVLPDVFVVHLWHPTSLQKKKYFVNRHFRYCLRKQEKDFYRYLHSKYK